jgi:hypothetical protein
LIRLLTLDEYDPKQIEKLCGALYTAFGVGCEPSSKIPLPSGVGDPVDARKLLEQVESVRAYADASCRRAPSPPRAMPCTEKIARW